MDDENVNKIEARPPTLKEFLDLCKSLNENDVKYIVVEGMAVIQHGLVRATEDIDLLVDVSLENEKKIKDALMKLPDQAARDLAPGDINRYVVVRVADEIVIDLMKSTCGIEYDEAKSHIIYITIDNIEIPFADMEILYKMKQTNREKDTLDKLFLEQKLKKRNK